jgi:hypothetical protein
MSSKKQTAVEWLISEIRNHIKEHGRLDAITISELKMKAKAMEKKQIIDAYRYGESNNFYRTEIIAKDYYTSTYE